MYLWMCFHFPVWGKWTPTETLEATGLCFSSLLSWLVYIYWVDWLFLILGHDVKCVKLTAVLLIGPVVALHPAVTDPAFGYTLVCGSSTVELWFLTGFCTCGQKQEGWQICTEIRPVTIVQWFTCKKKLLLDSLDKIWAVHLSKLGRR